MSSEIIQNVAYDNYNNFQHVNFIFSQKFMSLSCGLFNDGIDLKIKYFATRVQKGASIGACSMFQKHS